MVGNQILSVLFNSQLMSEPPRELRASSLPDLSCMVSQGLRDSALPSQDFPSLPVLRGLEGPAVPHPARVPVPSPPLGAGGSCCSADAHLLAPLRQPPPGFLPLVSVHHYLLFFKNICHPVIPLIKKMQCLPSAYQPRSQFLERHPGSLTTLIKPIIFLSLISRSVF